MKRWKWFLLGICLLGVVPRISSVHWNVIHHGDIEGDAAAAASLLTDGMLLVSHNPDVTSEPHVFPPGIGRNLLVAHPPIWALLGAATLAVTQWEPTFDNAFIALKILSLCAGVILIWLTAVVARQRFGDISALVIALWVACSYLMIDYSGNGALYGLQAITYLVWIFFASKEMKHKPVILGIVAGLGYLVNHQSMVLAASSVVVLLVRQRNWRQKSLDLAVVTLVTFFITLPWLLRNYHVYGDLFFSHAVNATYIYVKSALPREVIDGREHFVLDLASRLKIYHNVAFVWLPNNLYYIARKLFILAPIVFFFFSFAWIDYLFSRKRLMAMLPIVVLCALHLFLSASWPVTKFRYFVPLLPLVFFIGMDQIHAVVHRQKWRHCIYALVTCCLLALSYLTYLSVPTHTYYYDGAITNDPFHARGEYDFMVEKGLIPATVK